MVGHGAAQVGRQVGRDAQAGVEPRLVGQPAQQRQRGQAHHEHARNALDDVPVLEMAQLVRQHRLDLGRGQLAQQRVEKHHALGRAKAGEVGVGVGAAAAAVHHEQALGGKAAARHQLRDALFERFVLQRLKAVEQGGDEGGVDHKHQQAETHPRAPGPQPPPFARGLHQPQHQRGQRHANGQADQRGLEHVAQPQGPGHLVEAKALFDHEGLVERGGQLDQAVDDREGDQQRQRLQQRAGPQHAEQPAIERIQPAQQRPAQQHGGAQREIEQAKAQLGHGVVGGALVGVQADRACELRRHGGAVAGHGADLARRQPELDAQVGQQHGAD